MLTSPENNEQGDLSATDKEDYETGLNLADQLISGRISKEDFAREFSKRINEQKVVDPMTKLYTREGLKQELERGMLLSQRYNIPLTVLLMDGNKFKRINDEIDHLTGDKVIIAIAQALRLTLRRNDVVAHMPDSENNENTHRHHLQSELAHHGGDEFTVVLLGAGGENIDVVTEKLKENISRQVNEDVPEVKQKFQDDFTVSIGSAVYNSEIHQSWEDLLKDADLAMQRVKHETGQARV